MTSVKQSAAVAEDRTRACWNSSRPKFTWLSRLSPEVVDEVVCVEDDIGALFGKTRATQRRAPCGLHEDGSDEADDAGTHYEVGRHEGGPHDRDDCIIG